MGLKIFLNAVDSTPPTFEAPPLPALNENSLAMGVIILLMFFVIFLNMISPISINTLPTILNSPLVGPPSIKPFIASDTPPTIRPAAKPAMVRPLIAIPILLSRPPLDSFLPSEPLSGFSITTDVDSRALPSCFINSSLMDTTCTFISLPVLPSSVSNLVLVSERCRSFSIPLEGFGVLTACGVALVTLPTIPSLVLDSNPVRNDSNTAS